MTTPSPELKPSPWLVIYRTISLLKNLDVANSKVLLSSYDSADNLITKFRPRLLDYLRQIHLT